ncbi:MAG: ATP-dependent RecD-like DNA helicase [Lachnospiraceae bacterium]|nr:ATP-dependent RecD-like DNA helicase [Lachnospiraceae bacterium]
MVTLSGYIDHIIYQNDENGFMTFVLIPEGDVPEDEATADGKVTCTGNFPGVGSGENLRMQGEFISHRTYGRQFAAKSFAVEAPQEAEAVLRYLSSGAIRGVGPKLAEKIMNVFGADALKVMEKEPERLTSIKGISERIAMDIAEQMQDKRGLRNAMLYLSGLGLSNNQSVRIYNAYGDDLHRVIEENPYRLAEEIDGIGFKIADAIAAKMGIAVDSDFRIRCGILYVLNQMTTAGHTYLPREDLERHTGDLLGIDGVSMEDMLVALSLDKRIVIKYDNVYLHALYRAEAHSASMLVGLDCVYEIDEEAAQKRLAQIEREEGMTLDAVQRDAVLASVRRGVFVLTGGPGTGKTTTTKAIIRYFEKEGLDIFLAAPTGRAAKRMSEATGYEARTIHRMLGVSGDNFSSNENERRPMFEFNEDNPLECDVVIVDEVSMVDIRLLHSLLKAVAVGTRLILVGDENQLPSVGPGNVLRDIIASGCFSVVTLTTIFRQAGESNIIVNAHAINRGEHVKIDNAVSKDFFFMKRDTAEKVTGQLLRLVEKSMPDFLGIEPYDVQVLTPTRMGDVGVERLNIVLQKQLNPPAPGKQEHTFGDKTFRVGDKVMQIKNNYQTEWEVYGKNGRLIDAGTGVFNGDVGIVTQLDSVSQTLRVVFDEGREVVYTFKQVDELEHAYALTIHKSQGSEYPCVILPLLPGPRMLMNRNLLYTAITRASRCVVIVGLTDTFYAMIDNQTERRRYSGLKDRLTERIESENEK